jgi:hypothetical protein
MAFNSVPAVRAAGSIDVRHCFLMMNGPKAPWIKRSISMSARSILAQIRKRRC